MASFGVGAALRDERLRRQIPLEEIARQTKISERFLKAIESEDFESLPGVVFARSFVRQYAAVLDLDAASLLGALPPFDLDSAPLPAPPQRERQTWWAPRWNSVFASVAWTLVAVGAAVAAYIHFSQPLQSSSVQAAPPLSAPAKVAVKTAVDSATSPTEAPVADHRPLGPVPQADSKPVHLIVTAREDSWVQVTADGKNAYTGTLKANDSKTFDGDTLIKVLTGNAGGVELSLNGKTLGSLGPVGQVRSIRLTAEGPQPATPRNPAASSDPT